LSIIFILAQPIPDAPEDHVADSVQLGGHY
jgi:hypothetical protein